MNILEEAHEIINGSRQQTHGQKIKTFQMIASFWSVYLGAAVSMEDVCHMMSLLKKARGKCGLRCTDHYVDDIGYTAIAYEIGDTPLFPIEELGVKNDKN